MQYYSLQYWALLSPPDTSTTEHYFHFGPDLFLVLFLYFSLVAYRTPSDLEGSSSGVISFCLFILFMGFWRQKYWSSLPIPLPVDHILSELSTMTRPSWVALHGMAHSFIELGKPLHQDKAVIHEGESNSYIGYFKILLCFQSCLTSYFQR